MYYMAESKELRDTTTDRYLKMKDGNMYEVKIGKHLYENILMNTIRKEMTTAEW